MQIGIRSQIKDGGIVGEVFLSDQLINGAGYAKHLANSSFVEKILDDMSGELNELPILRNHDCDSSCYQCLRTYDNMIYHPILNWRLGLDIANLMQDSDFVPSLKANRWKDLVKSGLHNLMKIDEEGMLVNEDIPVVSFNFQEEVACIIKHPFWDDNCERIGSLKKSLEGEGLNVKIFDVFDLLHRPEWIIYKLKQSYDQSKENILF
ncbi:hypothetical protein U0355_12990 [Salimicrobium sp. PL1-032A]|uniref:hypothetical protein n=1 Tax=Salimicrobium sp. PL1-032A TaxID=3095364 RepID=UPI003261A8E7